MASLQSLKGFQAFTPVLRSGKKITAKEATLFFSTRAVNTPPDIGNIFLGVGVRRGTKPAVLRNRLKRLLRACFRLLVREYPVSELLQNRCMNIVILWYNIPKHPKQISFHQVYPVIMELWQQARATLAKASKQ